MLFEFREQFMIGVFLIELNQCDKTRSMGKFFISVGNLIIKLHI